TETPYEGVPDAYVYDPNDRTLATLEARQDEPFTLLRPTFPLDDPTDKLLLCATEGKALVYRSDPFLQPTEVSGFSKLASWIAIDRPDTDFLVAIYELRANGDTILLTSDLMRARYRLSLREETLVRSSEPLLYEFDNFTFVSREVKSGSRLCLFIGP